MWPTFSRKCGYSPYFVCMKQRYVTLQMLAIHVFMMRKQDGIVEKMNVRACSYVAVVQPCNGIVTNGTKNVT